MRNRAAYTYPADVLALAGPVLTLFDYGLADCGEASLASLALWVLSALEESRLKPETADDVFTLLDVYLTDLPARELSSEAQELLFEGEHFHHYGQSWGPDPEHFRGLAFQILNRIEKTQ